MEYLKLLGILIIVVGFVLKWDTTAVVVIAAIVTGLFSGMDFVKLNGKFIFPNLANDWASRITWIERLCG